MKDRVRAFVVGSWEPFLLAGLLTSLTYLFNWRNHFPIDSSDLLVCSVGLWLAVLAPAAMLSRRYRTLAFLGIAVLAAVVLIANQIYYRYYQDFITMSSLILVGQVYGVRDSLLPLAKPTDIAYLFPAFLFGGLYLRQKKSLVSKRFSGLTTALLMGLLGLGLFTSRFAPMLVQWGNGGLWDGNHTFVRQAGLFTFHVFDAQRFVSRKLSTSTLDPETLEWINHFFAQRVRQQNALTAIGSGMNLMVVQLESFESFPIGLTVGGQEITPNLNRLSNESLFFPNIYYQTAKGNTSDAEFMLNNSLLPLRDASVNWLYPENEYYSLPILLKSRGYSSVAFHGFNKIFWNRAFMYPRLGFDAFYSESSFQRDEVINIGLSDESFYRQSLEFLSNHPEPFYAQLVALTSHHPFRIPEAHRSLVLPSSLSEELRDYLHAVHYADKAVGSLLRGLEERGLDKRTIIAIYGDHEGISLTHFRDIRRLQGRHDSKQDELVKTTLQTIPLFIRVPGSAQRGTFEQVGGQVDILPTLANILGLEGEGIFLGQDLLEAPRKPTPLTGRYPLGSFTDDGTVYIASPEGPLALGSYYDRLTEESLDPSLAADKYREVLEMYQSSQYVIKHNLIPQLRERGFINRDAGEPATISLGSGD